MNQVERTFEMQARRDFLRSAAAFGLSLPIAIGSRDLAFADSSRNINIIAGADVSGLDPAKTNALKDLAVITAMADRLMRTSQTKAGAVEPQLATSVENVAPDRWRVKLRENVKFHNGSVFDAEAAKWSMDYAIEYVRLQSTFAIFDRIEIVDRHTIDLVTKFPTALVPFVLATGGVMLDPKWMTGPQYSQDRIVGTGPARFVEWIKGQRVVMEANPDYWGGKVSFQRLVTRAITEAGTRANAALAGEGDIVRNILAQDLPRFANRKGISVKKVDSNRCAHIRLRLNEPPFNNLKVRQALNHAVDIEGIITYVLSGLGTPVRTQMQGPQARFWQPSIKPYGYDPAKAKALLAEAGYPKGFKTKFGTPKGRDQGDYEFSAAVVGQLREVGVDAELIVHETGTYQAKYASAEPPEPLFYWSTGNQIPDAENSFRDVTLTLKPWAALNEPAFDAIYEKMKTSLVEEERNKIALEGITYIRDHAPMIFGYQLQQAYAVADDLNWAPRPDEYIYVDQIALRS